MHSRHRVTDVCVLHVRRRCELGVLGRLTVPLEVVGLDEGGRGIGCETEGWMNE